MDANEYQALAAETIQFDQKSSDAISIALLGLSGEVGELSVEFKKKLRDGDRYKVFKEKVVEELADIMWYVCTVATIEDILLEDVLKFSARKIKERWHDLSPEGQLSLEGDHLDDGREESEQLPRDFIAEFLPVKDAEERDFISVRINGVEAGNKLRDNAYQDDFYRFHDIFHLSYVTVLGWSPVMRKLLKRKRKSDRAVDEVEDGGRAAVIDEAISALVFEYARNHSFFEGITEIDYQLLRTVKMLTRHLEVKDCTTKQWDYAIRLGFQMWHELVKHHGGRVICNMQDKSMHFEKLSYTDQSGNAE